MIRFSSLILVVCSAAHAAAQDATITVYATQTGPRISRYLTGACVEDVNHEIYGGLYSQMIFGESFQEPAANPPNPVRGSTAYGGQWKVKEGELTAEAGPGPKLIADRAEFSEGEAGVEILFPDATAGNAGLIVKVAGPGEGADKFSGYEVALSPAEKSLRLGRHRQNWEPIRDVPCSVPVGRWIPLVVKMTETSLAVLVDGKQMIRYEDREHPLRSGRVGLRTWQRQAKFRNLLVKTGDARQPLALERDATPTEEVSRMWRPMHSGTARGSFALEPAKRFIGSQSQRITFLGGEGQIGVENQGLNRWGLCFQAGKPYEGRLWVRAEKPADISVAMESRDGAKTYATKQLRVEAGDWRPLDFTLTLAAADNAGRFAVKLQQPGSIVLGHAFLQPGPWGRFKGLPVRRDVAEALVAQGLTVLRYGGSMVNAAEYRWKKMIGPRDRRPPYKGTWYPYSTNGWGIVDFIDFCRAAGFLAVPDFNMDETPQDMADFVEYMNGPADSPWGKRRVADGRPEPYRLKYLQLGNEEAVNEDYWRRFKPLAEAIWAKDPEMILVVGDFAYEQPIKDPYHFAGAPGIRTLAAHKKILDLAKQHGREVWFDVHIGTDSPRDWQGLRGVPSLIEALGKISPEARFKVVIFEFNAGHHHLGRALGNARAINELQRIGDRVPIACSANCLQPYRQNDNDWDQGLLFLTPSQVWGQPPYYVTQMYARNYLPRCIAADVASPNRSLDATATTDDGGKLLQLQVVNLEGRPLRTAIKVKGFVPGKPVADITELQGVLNDINTPENPRRIVPQSRGWKYAIKDGETSYTFPPYSVTIIRWE